MVKKILIFILFIGIIIGNTSVVESRRIRDLASPVNTIIEKILPRRDKGINYSSILGGEEKVILLGEHHSDLQIKEELENKLPLFEERYGITHLGIELISSDFQPVIDRLKSNSGKHAEAREKLVNYFYHTLGGSRIDNPKKVADKYVDLIEKALNQGIEVVALDSSQDKINKYQDNAKVQKVREKHMAEVINKELSHDESSRMLFLGGMAHVEISQKKKGLVSMPSSKERLPNLLNTKYKLPVVRVGFVKGSGNSYIEEAIKNANLRKEQFSLKIEKDNSTLLPNLDWLIHLPESP